MEKWLLVVANERCNFAATQRYWLKRNLFLTVVPTITSAVDRLREREYMAVAVLIDDRARAAQLSALWAVRPNIPITLMASGQGKTPAEITRLLETATLVHAAGPPAPLAESSALRERGPQPMSYRDLAIYPQFRKVFFRGREVRLSRHQFEALHALFLNRGHPLTFGQLYGCIYGEPAEASGAYASARYFVSEIRRRMNAVGDFNYIENVRGIGYRINIECTPKKRSVV